MTSDVFASPPPQPPTALSHGYTLSPIGDRKPMEKGSKLLSFGSEVEPHQTGQDAKATPAILMRRLPGTTSAEALRSMLIFAKDLIDADFIPSKHSDDKGYLCAVARFRSIAGAREARDRLDGKANAANDANMIVELLSDSLPGPIGLRRNTVDGVSRQGGGANVAGGPGGGGGAGGGALHSSNKPSRFNGTFQSLEKLSPPPNPPGLGNGEFPVPESGGAIENLFSPTSPINSSFTPLNLGKSVINDETTDYADGLLLKESTNLGYASGGGAGSRGGPGGVPQAPIARRATSSSVPVTRFTHLSLNTNNTGANGIKGPAPGGGGPGTPNFASPRSAAPLQSPNNNQPQPMKAMSPHPVPPNAMGGMTPGAGYSQFPAQHYPRHHSNYPPVNPADQNPPCNTLYVGNLPIDTSEDELKAMFSKQRGYKRLCFRTKQNGPMCFVEFEDISFATKALNELYGQPLHNSVKGGIRLSFSKNPLGVRTGQSNGAGAGGGSASAAAAAAAAASMSPQNVMAGVVGAGTGGAQMGAAAGPPGFTTATGPPPGLAAPPGLGPGLGPSLGVGAVGHNGGGAAQFGMFPASNFGMPSGGDMGEQLRRQQHAHQHQLLGGGGGGGVSAGNAFGGANGGSAAYSTYMMGR